MSIFNSHIMIQVAYHFVGVVDVTKSQKKKKLINCQINILTLGLLNILG